MRRIHRCALIGVLASVLATAPATGSDEAYHVGPSDVLRILVWKHADLSGSYVVGADGMVTMPLVGRVDVQGMTAERIAAVLEDRLADGLLREPQVSVAVEQFRSQHVFLAGEVRQPGPVPITGSLTLLEALARAGALTERAGMWALIARGGSVPSGGAISAFDATVSMERVDLQALLAGDLTANRPLHDGDTVFVPTADTVHVMGEVHRPGSYAFLPTTRVAEILVRAGGLTERGSTGRLRVLRREDGRNVERKVKLDDTLQPGDVLVARERWF